MKIDRLLGITIYLLNHKKTSAQVLANHFEVSIRTIVRDIESLCMAGIPVISTFGSDGGYEIQNTFQMERQIAGATDYAYIVTALKGLATAYHNKEIDATLQKIQTVTNKTTSNVVLDFGVLSEKKNINDKLTILEQAVKEKHTVAFTYTNADNIQKNFEVEPVATLYQWYSWYLLSYYPKHKDYCTFKLNRMEQLEITTHSNSMEHNVDQAKESWENRPDSRKYLRIKLYCKNEIRLKCFEYLNGTLESEFDNGDFLYSLTVPENEMFWYGVLLSFGNKAKVLEPQELRQKICTTCGEILEEYKNF